MEEHRGPILSERAGRQILDCELCRFVHVWPLPSAEELRGLYEEQFYSIDWPEFIEKEAKEQDFWRKTLYSGRYEILDQLVPAFHSPRRILDVGCSAGFFLNYGKEIGWETMGVEPSHLAAEYARSNFGLMVHRGQFEEIPSMGLAGSFDVVHLRQVLEHLPDPRRLCEVAREVLRPDGVLCVECPNDFNSLQTLARTLEGIPDYWVSVPHHLNYFTFQSLRALLESMDFDVLHADTSFPMEFFLLMGDNYVSEPTMGPVCHAKRMKFELAMDSSEQTRLIRKRLYEFLAREGIGRTIVFYARRRSDARKRTSM